MFVTTTATTTMEPITLPPCACARGNKLIKLHEIKALQWNPSIMATIGERNIGYYRGMAAKQGFLIFNDDVYSWDQGEWPL